MESMGRRDFLASLALAGMISQETAGRATATKGPGAKPPAPWSGVNVGGWLAVEKWITPTVYAGTQAEDEYTLSDVLGKAKADDRLRRHRETWITADDFRWLAAHGVNAVRLPVNYGVAEENPPF